jgi:type II secretory pathway component PulC
MSSRLWLINLLLILMVFFLSAKVYDVWTYSKTGSLEGVVLRQKTTAFPTSVASVGKSEMPPPNRFQSISEKNLFSPDRKEFPISSTSDGTRGMVRPNLVLYGVAIGGDYHSAIISNPSKRLEKGERETLLVKVGDRVGGYQVTKILEDRVTLELDGDSIDLLLYDPAQPKKRPVLTPPATPSPPSPVPPQASTPSSPEMPRPSLPPPGIGQAPLPPSIGRELPRRNLLRQRLDQRGGPVPPGTSSPAGGAEK